MQSPDQLDYFHAIPKTAHTNDALRIFDLHGKVAVVTGATGVLGRALAIGLARAGAKVGILGRRSEAAEATSTAIREFQGQSMMAAFKPSITPSPTRRKCRIQVTLASGIPEEICNLINLGYRDPRSIVTEDFAGREETGVLLVPKAGERLRHLKKRPDWAREM